MLTFGFVPFLVYYLLSLSGLSRSCASAQPASSSTRAHADLCTCLHPLSTHEHRDFTLACGPLTNSVSGSDEAQNIFGKQARLLIQNNYIFSNSDWNVSVNRTLCIFFFFKKPSKITLAETLSSWLQDTVSCNLSIIELLAVASDRG